MPAEHDRVIEPSEFRQRALLDRYVAAFENADVSALIAVLSEDASFEMPPFLTWFHGRDAIGGFLGARMQELGKASVIRTSANGQAAIALYVGPLGSQRRLHSLHVLTVAAQGISRVVAFQDIAAARHFDLPASSS
jgi:ketosteroid isomerase-like protein